MLTFFFFFFVCDVFLQIVGEVLKQLTEEKCKFIEYLLQIRGYEYLRSELCQPAEIRFVFFWRSCLLTTELCETRSFVFFTLCLRITADKSIHMKMFVLSPWDQLHLTCLYLWRLFLPPLFLPVIVKATNGPRYVVGCRRQVGAAPVQTQIYFHLMILLQILTSVCSYSIELFWSFQSLKPFRTFYSRVVLKVSFRLPKTFESLISAHRLCSVSPHLKLAFLIHLSWKKSPFDLCWFLFKNVI